MRANLTGVLIAVITALGAWYLTGCREQAADTAAQEKEAPAEKQVAEKGQSEETQEAAEPAPEEQDLKEIEDLGGVLTAGSEEVRRKALKALTDTLLNGEAPDARVAAAQALKAMPDEAARDLLRAARNDVAPEVRVAAVEALAGATPTPWLHEQLARLRHTDDATVRAAAFRTEMSIRLNDPDKESGMRWLIAQLGDRNDDASAQTAIQLKLQGADALPYLIEALKTSKKAAQREVAACVIGLICAGTSPQQHEFAKLAMTQYKHGIAEPGPANLEGVKPLEQALSEDPSAEVRAVAAQGLGYLGQRSSAKVLGKALHDPAEIVRWWAASSLVTVPASDVVTDIADAVVNDESERVRRAAVRALGWVESSETVVMALVHATYDKSADVRRAAATQLGRIADPKAATALVRLFRDEDEDVRWAAVLAVGNLKDPQTVPSLTEALRDPSPMVANAAERALQKMGIGERRYGTRDEL